MKFKTSLLFLGSALLTLSLSFSNCAKFDAQLPVQGSDPGQLTAAPLTDEQGNPIVETPSTEGIPFPEITVALIGDTDVNSAFADALALVKSESPDILMINGDFAYLNDGEGLDEFYEYAATWKQRLLEQIDIENVAVIGSLGNHEVDPNSGDNAMEERFLQYFDDFRTPSNGLGNACTGQPTLSVSADVTLVNEVCNFGNLSIVVSGINQLYTDGFSTEFFEGALDTKLSDIPDSNWSLVGFHFSLASMNRAGKDTDQATHAFFDSIREYGAIGVQAHTHSASASCSISSPFVEGQPVVCDPQYLGDMAVRGLARGTGIFLDSSLGGRDVRSKSPCLNNGGDCTHLADLVTAQGYSFQDGPDQDISPRIGVFFIVFNEGGDPSRARVYFKDQSGAVIFQFNVIRAT